MSYEVQTILRVHILLFDTLEMMSLDTGAFFYDDYITKDQHGAHNKCLA